MSQTLTSPQGPAAARPPRTRRRRPPHRPAPGPDPLRAWLGVVDGLLGGIEQTLWQMREVADLTVEAVGDTRASLDELRARAQGLERQASRLPQMVARLSGSAWVLTQITASYRLYPTRAAFLSRASAEALRERVHEKNAQRIRDLCERQGGALLKVGQMLSARPDLLPQVWCDTLQSLQDDAPAVPFEQVRAVLERELGPDLNDHFLHLDEEPVAAASIGQVHRARLTDGRQVAVKIKRPAIDALVELDMQIMRMFVDASRDSLPALDYDTIVREVRDMIEAELDYRREASMTETVADMFQDHPHIHVPRTVSSLCSREVLVTEWMAGERITDALTRWQADAEAGDRTGIDRIGLALGRVIQAYLVQILEHGLFQADPHPGNLLLREDGSLVLLDFGCAKAIDDDAREAYLGLVQAFLMRDHAEIAQLLQRIGLQTWSGSLDALQRYTSIVLSEFDDARARGGWPAQAQVLASATAFLRELEDDPVIRLPVDFVMLGRVFGTLGGMFMQFKPRIDFARDLLPILARLAEAKRRAEHSV